MSHLLFKINSLKDKVRYSAKYSKFSISLSSPISYYPPIIFEVTYVFIKCTYLMQGYLHFLKIFI